MAKHVIKSDRSTQWLVNKDGHTWILEKQATLAVDPGPAVLIEDGFNKNKLFIDGDISAFGASAAEETTIRNDGNKNTFIFGEKAVVAADQGMVGTGDGTTVINHGLITTNDVAIAQNENFTLSNSGGINCAHSGVSVAQASLITNEASGEIETGSAGIWTFGDGASKIVNKGLISSFSVAIRDEEGSVTIRNTGTIEGDIELGSGRDVLNTIGGEVDGTVFGGDGSDIYRVSQSLLFIEEAVGQGNDTVYSTVNFTLWSNIEKLVLKGDDDLLGSGNGSDNELFGNDGDNKFFGVAGEDLIRGGRGRDILAGGADADTFVFRPNSDQEIVVDFEDNMDHILLVGIKGIENFDDAFGKLEQHGNDVWLETSGTRLVIRNTEIGMFGPEDLQTSAV